MTFWSRFGNKIPIKVLGSKRKFSMAPSYIFAINLCFYSKRVLPKVNKNMLGKYCFPSYKEEQIGAIKMCEVCSKDMITV